MAKSFKLQRMYLLCFLAAVLTAGTASAREEYELPLMTFQQGSDGFLVNHTNMDYVHYMWQSFVAVNWPASGDRSGAPDTSAQQPATKSPVVWESYRPPQEVFLSSEYWDEYPDWDNLPILPAGKTVAKIQSLCDGYQPGNAIVLHDINQPSETIRQGPVAPLIDQHGRYVRYQVNMSRIFFEYIRGNGYYQADRQQQAIKISELGQYKQLENMPPGAFVALPIDTKSEPGALETKAAWRLLDPEFDNAERYYTRTAFVLSPDQTQCSKATAGLVALHLHRMSRLSHIAATFEQIDNVKILDPDADSQMRPSFNPGRNNLTQTSIWPPYGNRGFQGALPPVITAKDSLPPLHRRQPNNVSRATPIPDWLQTINVAYRSKYQDTPLAYYQMVNTQHVDQSCSMQPSGDWSKPPLWQPATCPQPNTNRLINTALESYTQLINPYTHNAQNYSCRSCHSNARPCGFVEQETNKLSMRSEFQVMSFLLSKAQYLKQPFVPDGYSCNNPETQP